VIVNDDVDEAAAQLTALVRAALDGDSPNDAAAPNNGDPAA
jgi:hypothetical protein